MAAEPVCQPIKLPQAKFPTSKALEGNPAFDYLNSQSLEASQDLDDRTLDPWLQNAFFASSLDTAAVSLWENAVITYIH